ncbi:hypothetical protein R3P38DRAFT_3460845 [Favolaschia claudopus]|uniref:MACPF domain-containing protein n=1 Tax=Favolaschia claudopus TaxID=2862362 RepID=A0AAW0CNP0_9AGAR
MSDFDDYQTQAEKEEQWKIGAGRRKGIIIDLQRKLFPKLTQWPIVFIENGGGTHVHQQYPMLPNGELSHQNLFEAIHSVIQGEESDQASDLAGMQALQLLAGAEPFGKSFQPQKEILVDSTKEQFLTVIEEPPRTKTHCSPRAQALADQFLGVTYHPILGSYGRASVLKLGVSDVDFRKGQGTETYFTQVENLQEERTATATRLGCDFDVPQLARLSAFYSTSEGVKQAWNESSQLCVTRHLFEQVAVNPLCPELSDAMVKAISVLPGWSPDSKDVRQRYTDFFTSYGTHVVLRLALGGNIRVVTRKSLATDEHSHGRETRAEAKLNAEELGMKTGSSAGRKTTASEFDASGKIEIRIFVDGGGAVAGEVNSKLEDHFCRLPPEPKGGYKWPDDNARSRWIKALSTDPAFCPDHVYTEYRWLHTLGGLNEDQQRDLALAAEYYLRMWRGERPVSSQATGKKPVKDLPRKFNLERVKRSFKKLLFWRKNSSG